MRLLGILRLRGRLKELRLRLGLHVLDLRLHILQLWLGLNVLDLWLGLDVLNLRSLLDILNLSGERLRWTLNNLELSLRLWGSILNCLSLRQHKLLSC